MADSFEFKHLDLEVSKASAVECFVPEGQHDSSQARSAWDHEKNSPVPEGRLNRSRLRSDASEDFNRPSGTGVSLWIAPGTSCLATISLSLRDKSHSPIEVRRIKLALMAFEPRV